jgi:arylsulfatase A-like enzyme
LDAPVSLVDLLPTLLGLAGLPQPPDLDGLDISALWEGTQRSAFPDRYLYGEASGGLQQAAGLPGIYPIFRSIRKGRFKLIQQNLGGAIEYALYDLKQDPGEQLDVASLHAEVFAELQGELVRRHATLADAGPKGIEVELDQSEIDQLRALGYVP